VLLCLHAKGIDFVSRPVRLAAFEQFEDWFLKINPDGQVPVLVGEVVRGADLLDSTPRQVLLARALGLPEPRWAHVPLVLGPDGSRLAKRHGAVTLADRAARGETPGEVRGWLASTLGLAEPGERPGVGELLARFDPDRLPREPTVFAG